MAHKMPYCGCSAPWGSSFGVAQWLPGDQDKEQAMRRADQAMYDTKRSGSNRVARYGAAPT
jgi:GGDEF domain-containing protein